MNKSYSEKIKPKSKRPNENCNKSKPSVEAIKVTIEKKKECNSKALKIVTNFSDGIVSESSLVENLPFISQEHYQDIIEERAINKLCGYPPCGRHLDKIPTKQYHISTTHNKVFDITDRKNFCSNLCYKASRYLKDQILTSPLWLRDGQLSPEYRLISLQSKGGIVGDEVDLGHSCIKPEPDDSLSAGLSRTVSGAMLETNIDNLETKIYPSLANEYDDDSAEESRDSKCDPLPDNSQSFTFENTSPKHQNSFGEPSNGNETSSSSSVGISTSTEDKKMFIHVSPKEITENPESPVKVNSLLSNICNEDRTQINTLNLNELKTSNCVALDNSKVNSQKLISKPRKILHKKKTENKEIDICLSPVQSVVLKVEQILKEWLSFDSLCMLLGENKIKEILAEKKDYIKDYYNITCPTGDSHFYERYLAICKKLNILELEDTKVDASFREESKKPLPDYETLKEEAKNMDLKVRMFYRGDKQVQFGEPSNSENEQVLNEEPVLPLVDLHAQKALRRRIVIDKLRRVLQDLQKSLGLKGFNFSDEVRTLIGTFILSAHNITMKPGEWNLIAIVIIKLLSLKDKSLEQALGSSSTSKHLTLLLMSYSLDAGYLDRLIVWLTDIESVIQKLK
ncbi:putative RNA polymerase II subunit B1 CTD phosphatase RPAP2 isoform X2 [Homalodisca vitripennis]|uniref:putative RNA polymerase II subunit B1 CTD phosphatase RPAP2 isoform X2 n=1 Tax=Homalodisca vitripennis TaxID=197043 RepID=UPI001EEA7A9F|nr:putative RNA polymerase II subunit B1 CTD phosphatase RPAP2 isoform X2 [Homalodisca vitripennis]